MARIAQTNVVGGFRHHSEKRNPTSQNFPLPKYPPPPPVYCACSREYVETQLGLHCCLSYRCRTTMALIPSEALECLLGALLLGKDPRLQSLAYIGIEVAP